MVLTGPQSSFLRCSYGWLQGQYDLKIVPLRPNPKALERMSRLEEGYMKDLTLRETYAAEFACDERELVQNFRDQCAELSRTHRIVLFGDAAPMQALHTAATQVGIEQTFFLIEDLSSPMAEAASDSVCVLPGYWESKTPYILGHIIQYIDAEGMRCLDICNHATVLQWDMLTMGKSSPSLPTLGLYGSLKQLCHINCVWMLCL